MSKWILCFYRPIVLLFFNLLAIDTANSLKLLQVSIPSLKLTGQSARLSCLYDLEGDALYSIKWYKGGKEFFRFVQRDQPPIQVFPVDGINVDKSQSDQYQVTLTQLTVASAGRYKCEVSVEGPSFQTSFSTVEMNIFALPESGPHISTRGQQFDSNAYTSGNRLIVANTGDHRSYHSNYRPGEDEIEVNCTSLRSKPAAALQWYVDGIKVKGENLIEYAPFEDGDSLMETAVLGLRWKLPSASSFHDSESDTIVLNCTAAVGSVYWSSTALTLRPEPGLGGKSRPMLMYHESHLSSKAVMSSPWPTILIVVALIQVLHQTSASNCLIM